MVLCHINSLLNIDISPKIEFLKLDQKSDGKRHQVSCSCIYADKPHFNAISLEVLWVARSLGAPLSELLDIIHCDALVASQVQERVLEHAAVARRQNEAIAVHPLWILRIVLHLLGKEKVSDGCLAHRSTRMSAVSLVHGVHSQKADGVDALGVDINISGGGHANNLFFLCAALGWAHSGSSCQCRGTGTKHAGTCTNTTGWHRRCHRCWSGGDGIQLLSDKRAQRSNCPVKKAKNRKNTLKKNYEECMSFTSTGSTEGVSRRCVTLNQFTTVIVLQLSSVYVASPRLQPANFLKSRNCWCHKGRCQHGCGSAGSHCGSSTLRARSWHDGRGQRALGDYYATEPNAHPCKQYKHSQT